MLFLWISLGLLLLSVLALLTMLGCWTYSDAKARSDKPEIWTLIVLLVPNFIGLIIYLLVGRTKKAESADTAGKKFFIPLIVFGGLTALTFIATIVSAILTQF